MTVHPLRDGALLALQHRTGVWTPIAWFGPGMGEEATAARASVRADLESFMAVNACLIFVNFGKWDAIR